MRERGTIVAEEGDTLVVRIGSELCNACEAGHCGIRYSKLYVRPAKDLIYRVGDIVDIRTGFKQILTGMGRLFGLPALGVATALFLGTNVFWAVTTGVLVVVVVTMVGNRRWDLPKVERVVERTTVTSKEVLLRPVFGGDLYNS